MAASIGPKLRIDGEAEFRRQIEQITAKAKLLDSEMRLVTSSFDRATTAQEKTAAKSETLTKQIENQQKQVDTLTAYYEKGKEKLQQLNDALQKSIEEHGAESKETQNARYAYETYETALGKVETKLNTAKTDLNNLANSVQETGEEFDNAGQQAANFGDILKANLLSQAIMDGLRKITDMAKEFAGQMINAAAEVKAENAQFEQTFGDLAQTAKANLNEISTAAGILPERLKGSYTQFFAYARSSGMESTQAMEFATKATYAAADAAAYYDRSLEEATEQVLAYTKGNYANDAALGFASTEATRNAQALKSMGKEYKDLDVTAGEMTQVLLDQIITAQELSGAIGQASRESDGWENVTGNLSATWRKFQARVGAPALDALVPRIQKITKSFDRWADSIDTKKLDDKVEKLFDFVEKNGPTVAKVATTIGASFAGWQISKIATAGATSLANLFAQAKNGEGILKTIFNLTTGGGWAGGIALASAAIPGLIAAYEALKEATKSSTEVAQEEAEARIEGVQKSREAFAELIQAQAEQAEGDLAQIDHIQNLSMELDTLADASGNVAEKDRARAEFIVGQLNNALGTEIEMIDNQIQGYDTLQESIAKTIEQKKFQILLDSQMDVYSEAIKRQADLTREQAQAADDLNRQYDKYMQLVDDYLGWQKAEKKGNYELADSYRQKYEEYGYSLTEMGFGVLEEKEYLDTLKEAYDQHTQALSENYAVIQTVEDAQLLNMEGNTDDAIQLLKNLSSAYNQQSDNYKKTQEQQRQTAATNYGLALIALDQYLTRVKNKDEAFNDRRLRDLVQTAEDAKIEAEKIGVNMVDGTVQGLDNKSYNITNTLDRILNSGVNQVKQYENDFSWAGEQIGEGVARGIEGKIGRVEGASRALGAAANNSFRTYNSINSPSRLYRQNGEYIGLGLIKGLRQEFSAVRMAAAGLGRAAQQGFDASLLQPGAGLGVLPSGTPVTNNNTTLGGVTIQVYAQPGQDVNAIAAAVEQRMYNSVARREAQWA